MVQSVDRALTIITLVSKRKEGIGVTELASHLDLNKSSIFRLLSTLAEHGFIEQNPETKKYRLGYKYLELSSMLLESIDLRDQAKPYLEELKQFTNEVVHLVVYDQGEVVYIEKLEGSETLRTHSQVGRRAPLHSTSAGKVIYGHLPLNEIMDNLDKYGLPGYTEHTITDKDAFLKELSRIRNEGYATEIEENEPGVTCIAAPIFDHRKKIVAAISVSGPSMRMTTERLNEMKPVIMEIGKKISKRLGYTEH
ncbi:IclR family transcriptional regulator [Ectobacillus ponti]|uniref:Glycerol operon regulatory protein n=1 Tax=Ectobacillus ponti TaxID=2961894 RepID=A0AA42BNS4_9BACI|nr:IclR family transcriptional regulator [Ectobacillus ponti]MCP8967676.1 IclR family transcriptional regulator [Ectobacillus ponti]